MTIDRHVLYLFTFLAIDFGCLLNCLPDALSLLFLAVVLAYSLADKDLIAFAGRYLSPVLEDGLPDLVLHFCLDHLDNDVLDLPPPLYPPPAFLYAFTAAWAFLPDHCPAAVPCDACDFILATIRFHS